MSWKSGAGSWIPQDIWMYIQFWACFIVTKINIWQIKAVKYKETELFNRTRRSRFSLSHKTLKSPFWNLQHSHKIIILFICQEETGILQKCRTAVEALFPCLSPNIYNCWSFGIPHSPTLFLCAWMNIPGYRTGLANCTVETEYLERVRIHRNAKQNETSSYLH